MASKSRGKIQNAKKKNASVSSLTDSSSDHRHQRLVADDDNDDADERTICPCCNDTVYDLTNHIKCDGCKQTFHQECTGLTNDVFIILVGIVKHTGWVCQQCRSELNSMQSALTKTSEELADIRASLVHLSEEMNTLKSNTKERLQANTTAISPANSLQPQSPSATRDSSVLNMQLEIHRTVNDITKRKSNVVITGMREPEGNTDAELKAADKEAFEKLCEENLSLKPAILHNGCIRLGKANTQRPRKLLIRLHSEVSATNLLTAAKELRRSNNDFIARNIYINPDLSPAAAKLAYEQRQRRRSTTAQRTAQTASAPTGSMTDTTAPFHDCSSE